MCVCWFCTFCKYYLMHGFEIYTALFIFYLKNNYYLMSFYTKGVTLMHNQDVLLMCAVLVLM